MCVNPDGRRPSLGGLLTNPVLLGWASLITDRPFASMREAMAMASRACPSNFRAAGGQGLPVATRPCASSASTNSKGARHLAGPCSSRHHQCLHAPNDAYSGPSASPPRPVRVTPDEAGSASNVQAGQSYFGVDTWKLSGTTRRVEPCLHKRSRVA
jgi:hypothetical protein